MSQARPDAVVVTGLGVASPLGCTVDAFWSGLLSGASGVTHLDNEALAHCRTRIGAPVAGFDPDEHLSPQEQARMNLASQLAQVAAKQALDQAGLDAEACQERAIGTLIGSSAGGFIATEHAMACYFREGRVNDPLTVPLLMNNAAASNLSIRFGLTGPLMTIDAACASSPHAIGTAYRLIKAGLLSAAVTGGADATLSPSFIHAWSALRALSESNDDPKRACRPFSKDRDGMVLGDGAGILVLESERSARERDAQILAEVSGYGATSDGHHMTVPSTHGIGRAMRDAIGDARLAPDDVDYVNAHATGTRRNDVTETQAIHEVLGARAREIPVVGIKPAVAHSIAASGALECISCVLTLRDQVVPPTLNLGAPDPECDLDYVSDGARECAVDTVMSNSFAFGGSNGVLVLSRYHGRSR